MSRSSREARCRARIYKAAGGPLSEDDFIRVMEDIQSRARIKEAAGMDPVNAARAAGADAAAAARLAAQIERRNRLNNIRIDEDLAARVIPKRESDSFHGAVTGKVRAGQMLGMSVDALGHRLKKAHVGELLKDMYHAGLISVLRRRNPDLDKEITREMWWHDDPGGQRPKNSETAQVAGEIFSRHVENMRLALNEAGAWIDKLEHHVVRQGHDMFKIARAGYDAWRDFILPRLDPKTFDGLDVTGGADPGPAVDKFLRQVYNDLASGLHGTTNGSEWLTGFKGPGNLAKRLSREEVLHFKGPDEFWEYNKQFGRGTVTYAVLQTLEHGSKNLAMMRTFGTNPVDRIQRWGRKLAETARDDGRPGDVLGVKEIEDAAQMANGTASLPKNMSLAWWAGTIRNMQYMVHLGGAVISSFSDIPATVAMLRHHGINPLQAYAHQFMALLPQGGAARRDALIELGGMIDGILGDAHARLRAEDGRYGGLARETNLYFKLNLLNWWTDRMRTGAATAIAARYADYAERGLSFDGLPALARDTLNRYGIGPAEWAALRQVQRRTPDSSRAMLMPREIMALSDDAVSGLGGTAERARQTLMDRYGTMIDDQIREGISEPTLGQRNVLTFGTQAGTAIGELQRTTMQFQSFAGTFLMRSVGREIFRGAGGGVDIGGIVHLMIATTIFGALSITVRDLISGKEPRLIEGGVDLLKFASASLVHGGGMGILGDFLFGSANRMGGGLAESLTGPTVGTLGQVQRMLGTLERGGEHGNLPSDAVSLARTHAPFMNLFYLRAAVNHLLFYGLQESVNPGYLRRVEQKSRRDFKQEHWLRPTQAVRY
jgi:hypothetical protein